MTITDSWKEIKNLLSSGLSIMPVREKDKTPVTETWKQYQGKVITEEFLFHQMEKYNTTSVAIIGGRISGNLEIIDIDEKYEPGISSLVLIDLKTLFPDIYEKLRVHKSPSGGYHLLYRVSDFLVPSSHKVSKRETTQEEKIEFKINHPETKKDLHTINFIETRGEGGYALTPPSNGYEIINNVEIPTITESERNSIYNICKNYNKVRIEPKVYKTETNKINYYDENPWNHYSRVADPIELLTSIGWKLEYQRGKYIWFTRPGKNKGVSASFDIETRIFWAFTSSTDFENYKGFFLASILTEYKFNNDKKSAYLWLTQNGYGKVNSKLEQQQIKKKALTEEEIPDNFSEEAKEGYKQLVEDLKKMHPFGIFWEQDDKNIITISRTRLYAVSEELGYRSYQNQLVRISNKFLVFVEIREYFDEIKNYIKVDDKNMYEDIINSYEAFIEKHGKFTTERLRIIDDCDILNDTKHICYKFYLDQYVVITKNNVQSLSYENLDKIVLSEKIQNRNLVIKSGGKYIDFLNKACELDVNEDYIKKIIGYYAHDYNDETMGYMVILTEKTLDPKYGGRSGKNIFVKLLGCTTSVIDKAGSQTKFDDKIFQLWNGERVFSISDLPKDFDLTYFKNISTGGFVEWKLFKNQKAVTISKSFKLIFSTNYSFNCSDGGIAARVIALEFTDFFKMSNGVDTYYDAYFPKDWNQDDWAGYDDFIIKSIQTWLKCGCKIKSKVLSNTGWQKQFDQIYGITIAGFIEEYWSKWVNNKVVSTQEFKNHLNSYFEDNLIAHSQRGYATSTKINRALEDYAKQTNVIFDKDYNDSQKGKSRLFDKQDLPF